MISTLIGVQMARVKAQDKKEREIIDAAIKRLDTCVRAEAENRNRAIQDLRFVSGDQWDAGEKKRRADKGRPALQFNLLSKFVDQVVGDMLHNSPSIKLRPADSKADPNIALIRQGIIANIEYVSNSKSIYSYAGTQQVTCGYGAWRVLTRYAEENPFVQEAYLESVRNPFLIYMDPSAKDQFYADAKYGFVLEKMSVDDFKEAYPKAKIPGELSSGDGLNLEHWYDEETVTVAEYFTTEEEAVEMLQLEDGRVVTREEFNEILEVWKIKNNVMSDELFSAVDRLSEQEEQPAMPPQGAPQGMPPQGAPNPEEILKKAVDAMEPEPKIIRTRDTKRTVIRQRILTACEILDGGIDGNVFPGKFIPLIIVKGKELNIEGQNQVYGLVHNAIDAQKMYNYWQSAAAETIALAPKAPWVGTPRQFEGFENDYAGANVENLPFLKFNPDPENPGPPQRQAPAQPPLAIFQQIANGEAQMKSIIGLFAADLGQPGSEQTGAAITARQKPGDISTYVFSENLARAVLHTGKILNEMIPEIYDTERDVRIRHFDDSESFVPVNTTLQQAMQAIKMRPELYAGVTPEQVRELIKMNGPDSKFNDITAGKYDVVVTTGPSYATQRQESAVHLLQMAQAMPQQMALAADLIVKNLDFKDAEELAERLRKTLPPGMVPPKPGDPPPPPPPPNPEVELAKVKMQQQQMEIQTQQMKLEQEKLKMQHEQMLMQMEMKKLEMELQLKPMRDQQEISEKKVKFALEHDRIQLEKERLEYQKQRDIEERRFEATKEVAKYTMQDRKESPQ